MASTAVQALMRTNIGYTSEESVPEPMKDMMVNDLDTAVADLARDGIIVDEKKADDRNLIVMYAVWLWNRRKTGEGKPEMLALAIRNRQVHLATKGAGS